MDAKGLTPLRYALNLGNPEAIRILLDNGAIIDLENTFLLCTYCPSLAKDLGWHSVEVLDLLCLELAQRRREMCKLAMGYLYSAEFQQFGLESGGTLQENAFEIAGALKNRLGKCPRCVDNVQPGSLYHSGALNLHLATYAR